MVNPRQAQELLTVVTYVGRRGRGRRLMALFACMYYAALRPAEAIVLRKEDCDLPEKGWGRLLIDVSRPEVNTQWTDTGDAHEERGLKHRGRDDVRPVPIPPTLVKILRDYIAEFGLGSDGRLFQSERGGVVASTAYTEVWQEARKLAFRRTDDAWQPEPSEISPREERGDTIRPMSDRTVSEYAYTYASPTSRRADGGECIWYRSHEGSYDLIRTGKEGRRRYHVFDAQSGEHLEEFASWDAGHQWIEERLRSA